MNDEIRKTKVKQVAKAVGEDVKKILNDATMNDTEKKPFLTEEDALDIAGDLYSSWNEKDEYNACINGYKAASKKANTHISSLESELKALREERDVIDNEMQNKIIVQWEKDFGSIHKKMDAYTVSGFIKDILEQFKATKTKT